MILFRCSSCGEAYRVADKYANGSADCQKCGAAISIPGESDPEVVLIYKAGESEDGLALTREQVTAAFEAGTLLATDLILDEGTWRPLSAELHAADVAASLGGKADDLKLRLQNPVDGRSETLHRLPQIRLARPILTEEDEAEQRRKIHFSLIRMGEESDESEPGEAEELEAVQGRGAKPPEVNTKRQVRRTLMISGQLLAGLLALWYGFKLGIGPLVSSIRGKSTLVSIVNPGKTDYTAVLGWRHLHRHLPKGGACCFETYVGMRERQGLTLKPAGGGPSIKVKVPMRPGGKILVNPKGAVRLCTLFPGKIGRLSVREVSDVLTEQIIENGAPDAADVLFDLMEGFVKVTLGEPVRGEFLDGAAYRFGAGLEGCKPPPKPGKKKADKKVKKTGPPLPLLVRAEKPQRATFREGYLSVRAAAPRTIEGALRLKAVTVSLPPNITIKIPKGTELKIKRTAGRSDLAFDLQNQTITPQKTKFRGVWQYRAWSAEPGRWGWVWVFHGEGKIKGKKKKLTLRFKNGGQVPLVEWK